MIFISKKIFIFSLVLTSLLASNVFASKDNLKKDANFKKYDDWVLVCDENVNNKKDSKKHVCFLKQQVVATKEDKTQDILAFYQIGYFGKENKLRMMQILSTADIYIPAGTMISSDAKVLSRGQYIICSSNNCQALSEISNSDLDSMINGKEVKLFIMNSAMQQVFYPVSVKGLKEGLASLKKFGPIEMEQIDVTPKSSISTPKNK